MRLMEPTEERAARWWQPLIVHDLEKNGEEKIRYRVLVADMSVLVG